jgi:hypothetical protein
VNTDLKGAPDRTVRRPDLDLESAGNRTDWRSIMNSSARTDQVTLDRPEGTARRSGWRTVNITAAERLGRIAVGVAAVIAGIVLLTSAGSALAVGLEALLIAAGADLAITGAMGHCPLYAWLGYLPKSLRSPR